MPGVTLSDAVYRRLLLLRTGLRHFERWSEQQAGAAGLTPAQHQLLLAIRGHNDPRGPTIGEVADYLLLRHHSVVGLIDRADESGLVSRARDRNDHRIVRLRLTKRGARRLEGLSALHLEELERLATELPGAWEGLAPVQRAHGFPGPAWPLPQRRAKPMNISVACVNDEIGKDPGPRVLVDRIWPRGLARSDAPFDTWLKDVAPSPELRKWYGQAADRFEEFGRRYRKELSRAPASEAVDALRQQAQKSDTVLLTATKNLAASHAIILNEVLLDL